MVRWSTPLPGEFVLADPATFTRPRFGWGDALFAELLLDLTGRSTAALHPRLSTTQPPSR